jgi:small subunit ribosomal protein S5
MEKKSRHTRRPAADKEFQQRVIDLARVTRVMAGGKRMRFRACVAIGDKKGRCAIGLAKGADVTIAINKAVARAKKKLINVPIINETIPHRLYIKEGAARLLLKPAPVGTGIKAGGAIRIVLELAGVPNVSAKILGTNNKINNVQALIKALTSFKSAPKKVEADKKETKSDIPEQEPDNKANKATEPEKELETETNNQEPDENKSEKAKKDK